LYADPGQADTSQDETETSFAERHEGGKSAEEGQGKKSDENEKIIFQKLN
jgi:hypothetical protein